MCICNGTLYPVDTMRFYFHKFVIRTSLSLTILPVKHSILQIIACSRLIVMSMNRTDLYSRYLEDGNRLLIIAPDTEILQFLEDHYSKRHYKTLCVSSSKDAIKTVKEFLPHVVLMSLTFGLELLRQIREIDEFCSILLFTSGENIESEELTHHDFFIADAVFHVDAPEEAELPELLSDIGWTFDAQLSRFKSKYLGGFVFVLMPFSKEVDHVYFSGIKPCVESCGLTCERVDEQHFTDSILSTIFENIKKARFIVAEMTGKNPNVFYEVGYAHAINKPVILIADNLKDIPFDLKDKPHIEYNGDIEVLKTMLAMRLRGLISKRVGWTTDS